MIEYIKGNLTDLTPTYAVIEAAGVGYAINIALPTYSALVGKENTETKLYVTEIIREDTHDLFGFFTRGERELFLMLMTVSGIGANTARMIMSAYSASEIRQIIATGNARALSQVKGLGPKTAQRIIVDLKDKVLKIDIESQEPGAKNQDIFPSWLKAKGVLLNVVFAVIIVLLDVLFVSWMAGNDFADNLLSKVMGGLMIAASILANFWMIHKKIDTWIWWIVYTVAGMVIYVLTNNIFTFVLFLITLVLNIKAAVEWIKLTRGNEMSN